MWFRAPYVPKCRTCGKSYAENKVTNGELSYGPFCEKCANEKIDELNTPPLTGPTEPKA